jgi:Amt family ammonium transporter
MGRLLHGNLGQFMAQVVGGVVCFAWAFGASFPFFKILDRFVKLRVSPADEMAGLDIPEMGLAGHVPDDLPVPAFEPRAATRGVEPALGTA